MKTCEGDRESHQKLLEGITSVKKHSKGGSGKERSCKKDLRAHLGIDLGLRGNPPGN